jgi:fucose permease
MAVLGRGTEEAVPPLADGAVQAARWALVGLFAVNGLTLSAWLARLPALRDAMGVSPGQLGTVLLAASLGGLLMMTVAPRVVGRLGHPDSMRAFGVLFAVAYTLMGVGTTLGSLLILVVGLFLNGVALAGNNLTLNLGSATVEREVRRPILSQFHAAFSIGTVVGSLAGAGAAALSVPLLAQFLAMAVVASAWRLLAASRLLSERPRLRARRGAAGRPGRVDAAGRARDAATLEATRPQAGRSRAGLLTTWRERRALLIGAIILVAVISEFAANDWLALAVVDGYGASESVAALVFALFVGAMTVVRLLGSAFIGRFGRVAVLRGGAVTSILGVLLFVLAPSVPLAAVGALLWGAGAALNFPLAVSASSDDPGRAAHRISVLSMFAAVAPLVEPVGIGALADQVGVRYALLAIAVVLVFIVLTARQVRPEETAAAPARVEARALSPAEAVSR